MDRKSLLLAGLDLPNVYGAEIGALDRPLVHKHEGRVFYVDHCNTEELQRRYASDPNVDTARLHVDAVWGQQTLAEALLTAAGLPQESDARLGYMLASHVIEHVPDFVGWLDEVHVTLDAGPQQRGVLRLAVPDKRYCFDILRTPTVLVDVLEAYALRRRRPSARCIMDFALNMREVDLGLAWNGQLDLTQLRRPYTLEGALHLARDAEFNGKYHDVHCWVFTPHSFASLCLQLAELGLLKFECEWLVDSPRDTFEFYVSLRPMSTQQAAVQSWQEALRQLEPASPSVEASVA